MRRFLAPILSSALYAALAGVLLSAVIGCAGTTPRTLHASMNLPRPADQPAAVSKIARQLER